MVCLQHAVSASRMLTPFPLQVAGSQTVIPLTSNSVTEEAAWCYTYAQVMTPCFSAAVHVSLLDADCAAPITRRLKWAWTQVNKVLLERILQQHDLLIGGDEGKRFYKVRSLGPFPWT